MTCRLRGFHLPALHLSRIVRIAYGGLLCVRVSYILNLMQLFSFVSLYCPKPIHLYCATRLVSLDAAARLLVIYHTATLGAERICPAVLNSLSSLLKIIQHRTAETARHSSTNSCSPKLPINHKGGLHCSTVRVCNPIPIPITNSSYSHVAYVRPSGFPIISAPPRLLYNLVPEIE